MPTIALVTADPVVVNGEDLDAEILIPAFAEAAIEAAYARWDDPDVEWSIFDLVIMRSPWDYPERLPEFLTWLGRTATMTQVLNAPDVIRWNLDKAYLLELSSLGVPIVASALCDTVEEVAAAIGAACADEVVVKPNISVGSRDTGRFRHDDETVLGLAQAILSAGKRVLVQPSIPDVADHGETALVYFDGTFSHGFRKGPILELGGGYLGGRYTEVITPEVPTQGAIEVADAAVQAIATIAHAAAFDLADPTPLYVRFDIVNAETGPALLEAELFEPSYFLHTAPGAERTFVEAVRRRIVSTGATPITSG